MAILYSKVTRPAPTPQILDRPRLYARLDRWQRTPVVFVHAPAGYGKSMLVSRWIEARGLAAQSAWLSLDPGDDAPVQFVRYLAAALEPVVPGIMVAVEPVLDTPEPHPMRALEVMLGAVDQAPNGGNDTPILLVLDDLHHVDSPELAPLMTLALERRPPRLHFMLLGRQAIYGPLARLYAAEQVLEMSEAELRFQRDEMETYLAQRDFPHLTPEALTRLVARTEGWIVALQLMAAAAGDTLDIDELLTTGPSGRDWLVEYLTTQILDAFPSTMRDFLLRTSILDRFNASLSALVTDTTDADPLLSKMVEGGVPLVQLDNQREWFRYHHLFQELLKAQLRRTHSRAAIATLHHRAATWLARHNQVTAAVQHALCADDRSLAAAILEAAVRPEILRGDTRQAQDWLTLFPNNALDQHPPLLLDWCLLAMLRNQTNLVELVARTDAALALAQLTAEERRRTQAELVIFTIIARLYRREFDTVRELVQDNDHCLAAAEPLIQGLLAYVQMHLAWYEGQFDDALISGNQAVEAFQDAGFDYIVMSVRIDRAQLSAHRGYPREALAMHQELVAAVQVNGSFVIQELALAHVTAMNLHYWMDDIEAAQREQQSALALAQRLADPDTISEIASLDALFGMARVTDKASEIEASWPRDTVSTIPQLNRLHLHKLVRQGQLERARHFATAFGVRLDSEITTENLFYFILLLKITIARGSELERVMPRLADAFVKAERLESRLFVAELYALSAWAHLQLEQRQEAEEALRQALDLAVDTGYVRFIIDIPALAPLLALLDHPAAADMWVATVSDAQRCQAARLTDRERHVLVHLMRPARYQDIADDLGISIGTVRTHISHVYAKLGVNKRNDAVARAQALGLTAEHIDPSPISKSVEVRETTHVS